MPTIKHAHRFFVMTQPVLG